MTAAAGLGAGLAHQASACFRSYFLSVSWKCKGKGREGREKGKHEKEMTIKKRRGKEK